MNNNIILIGMPGVGKSTIGPFLAKKLNYKYLDTDTLIEHRIKMKLSDFIKINGVAEFKKIENKIITSIQINNCVISTGGSVVYEALTMEYLKTLGKIIYLENDFSVIEKRILSAPDRGLVMSKNQTLNDLYLERIELYQKYSDIKISCNNLSVSQIGDEIIKQLDHKKIISLRN